jgi:hypothetical protein|tara:strand:- start:536 stop:739 length:204 start_codon:yes stop_codon:yes gene_type:complete
MFSIYINDKSDIPEDVLAAINDMQAVFGVQNRYLAHFSEITDHIKLNSGSEIARQVKESFFVIPEHL